MLETNGLFIAYGPVEVVHGVTMQVEKGKIVSLIGPNGAGKSSILKAISGLIRPTGGNILFLGASLVGVPPHEIAAAGIAHVLEGRHLFGGLTVEDNLLLATATDASASVGSMEAVFQRWPLLGQRRDQLAGTLSGGEQQMLAIARALIARPRLLMLDEPSWGLAPRVVKDLMQTVQQLRTEGMTILLVEQMAKMALKVCDYGYVMANGRIVAEGSAEELLSNPDLQAMYLGAEVGAKKPERVIKSPPEADLEREPMPKPVQPTDHSLKEKQRKDREKTKTGTIALAGTYLRPPVDESDRESLQTFQEGERMRQIRQSSFGSEQAYSDLKKELGRIQRDISDMKEHRTAAEEKAPFTPSTAKRDWQALEMQRREQQAAWRAEMVEEPESKVGPGGAEAKKGWKILEAVRRKKQVSHTRQPDAPSGSEISNRAEREKLRQEREQEWRRKRGTGKGTETDYETRPMKDYSQFEMKRREREKEQRFGNHSRSHLEAAGTRQFDWKSRELARKRKQAQAKEKGNKWSTVFAGEGEHSEH